MYFVTVLGGGGIGGFRSWAVNVKQRGAGMKFSRDNDIEIVFDDIKETLFVCAAVIGILSNPKIELDRLCFNDEIDDIDVEYLRKLADAAWQFKTALKDVGDF
jgi:hypothetical protein